MNPLPLDIDPKGAAGALKVPLALVPPSASAAIAKVLQRGAEKYGQWNWRKARVGRMTYAHAIKRHLDAWIDGEDNDPESGLPHIAAVAASACIVLDAELFGTLEDDRPPGKPPAAPSLSVPDAEPPSNIVSFTDGSVVDVPKHLCASLRDIRGVCVVCGSQFPPPASKPIRPTCIGECEHTGPFGQCAKCDALP